MFFIKSKHIKKPASISQDKFLSVAGIVEKKIHFLFYKTKYLKEKKINYEQSS